MNHIKKEIQGERERETEKSAPHKQNSITTVKRFIVHIPNVTFFSHFFKDLMLEFASNAISVLIPQKQNK